MKNLIVISLLFASAFATETNTQAEIQARQQLSMRSVLNEYVGHWEGGGMQTIFSLGTSVPEDRLVPNGFEQFSNDTLFLQKRTGIKPMHEEGDYWFLEDNNLLALNAFMTVGYSKLVHEAVVDGNGILPTDSNGDPIFTVDTSHPAIHQETGYIVSFTDRFGFTRVCKMILIPRGLTVLANGALIGDLFLEFDSDDNDSDFGIVDHPLQQAEASVRQRNFHQAIRLFPGSVNCGAGCTPRRMEYDEFFRMDVHEASGSRRNLFHREHAFFNKISNVPKTTMMR